MADVADLFSKLGEEESRAFVYGVIDSLCDKEGLRFEQFASSLSISEYARLKNTVATSVRQISREGFDRKTLTESAQKLNGANNDIASLLAECIWVRRDEIKCQLVKETCDISHTNLEDYDWQTKLALSSDKLGSLQEPLFSLDLHINEGGVRNTENIELSKDELRNLVSALDSANKVVLQLRT